MSWNSPTRVPGDPFPEDENLFVVLLAMAPSSQDATAPATLLALDAKVPGRGYDMPTRSGSEDRAADKGAVAPPGF
jgi:hypothetical protein